MASGKQDKPVSKPTAPVTYEEFLKRMKNGRGFLGC